MSPHACRRLAWITAAAAWSIGSLVLLGTALAGVRADPVMVLLWLILATIPTAAALVITALPDASAIATAAYLAGQDDAGGSIRPIRR